jgi:hypothetical protein
MHLGESMSVIRSEIRTRSQLLLHTSDVIQPVVLLTSL